jgi:hypothetical protein
MAEAIERDLCHVPAVVCHTVADNPLVQERKTLRDIQGNRGWEVAVVRAGLEEAEFDDGGPLLEA